jgi:hypothetical protein
LRRRKRKLEDATSSWVDDPEPMDADFDGEVDAAIQEFDDEEKAVVAQQVHFLMTFSNKKYLLIFALDTFFATFPLVLSSSKHQTRVSSIIFEWLAHFLGSKSASLHDAILSCVRLEFSFRKQRPRLESLRYLSDDQWHSVQWICVRVCFTFECGNYLKTCFLTMSFYFYHFLRVRLRNFFGD